VGSNFGPNLRRPSTSSGPPGRLSYVNDVTASVVPYISAGMTFEESESVLRAAGFVVRPRPGIREEQDPHRLRDWYAVHAEMPDFPRRVLGRIDVYVTLYPESPGDYGMLRTSRRQSSSRYYKPELQRWPRKA
jgi:hypothetical protein